MKNVALPNKMFRNGDVNGRYTAAKRLKLLKLRGTNPSRQFLSVSNDGSKVAVMRKGDELLTWQERLVVIRNSSGPKARIFCAKDLVDPGILKAIQTQYRKLRDEFLKLPWHQRKESNRVFLDARPTSGKAYEPLHDEITRNALKSFVSSFPSYMKSMLLNAEENTEVKAFLRDFL